MFAFGMPKFVIAASPASGLFVIGLYWKYPNRKSASKLELNVFVTPSRQAVIVHFGTSRQAARAESDTADGSQTRCTGQSEAVQAEAAENAEALARREVDSRVEAVLVVGTRSGADKVVQAPRRVAPRAQVPELVGFGKAASIVIAAGDNCADGNQELAGAPPVRTRRQRNVMSRGPAEHVASLTTRRSPVVGS